MDLKRWFIFEFLLNPSWYCILYIHNSLYLLVAGDIQLRHQRLYSVCLLNTTTRNYTGDQRRGWNIFLVLKNQITRLQHEEDYKYCQKIILNLPNQLKRLMEPLYTMLSVCSTPQLGITQGIKQEVEIYFLKQISRLHTHNTQKTTKIERWKIKPIKTSIEHLMKFF